MDAVSAVRFPNRDGLQLFGVLHKAKDGDVNKPVIILLSPGVKMRVAPHRLYIQMTEHFVRLGFSVFRFDFHGLGDSEGEIGEHYLADLYNSVALGRYIDDTLAAMDWVEEQTGASTFILSGLCGGALTGLLSGSDDPRVVGLLGLGIPAVLDNSDTDKVKNLSKGQLNQLRSGYFRNLLNVKSWVRLLSFQSDFRTIFRSLMEMLAGKKSISKPKDSQLPGEVQSAPVVDVGNINPLFGPAFFKMLESSRRMIFIFSGADRLFWEFEEKFSERNQALLGKYSNLFDVHTVKDANHIFSNKVWQDEMLNYADNWLKKYY